MNRRLSLQIFFLVLFAFLLSGFFYRVTFAAISLSPLLGLANLIHGHPWTWKLLLPVPVLLLAFFKGRFFCYYFCPTGTVLEYVPLGVRNKAPSSRVAGILLVVVLASAFFTLAVAGLLDPLIIFAGFVNAFQYSFGPELLWLAGPLAVLIILNVFGRRYWCRRLCPLGYLLGVAGRAGSFLGEAGRFRYGQAGSSGLSRRSFLTALAGGVALGWGGAGPLASVGGRSGSLIRPPGALARGLFNRKCIRCGNCMKACVTDGLIPCTLDAGWDGIFTPRLYPSVGYCDEYCTACTHSCPTGALRPLSLEEKREERLGRARVNREKCMAWADDKYCLVCQEVCPYVAIDIHRKENGIPCPIVSPARCRGCGQCEYKCKTEVSSAIKVYSLKQL